MNYYENDEILIRDMITSDAQTITDEEIKQGWHQTTEKYEMRLKDQAAGKSFAIVAEVFVRSMRTAVMMMILSYSFQRS